jgi:hypothetical protein
MAALHLACCAIWQHYTCITLLVSLLPLPSLPTLLQNSPVKLRLGAVDYTHHLLQLLLLLPTCSPCNQTGP